MTVMVLMTAMELLSVMLLMTVMVLMTVMELLSVMLLMTVMALLTVVDLLTVMLLIIVMVIGNLYVFDDCHSIVDCHGGDDLVPGFDELVFVFMLVMEVTPSVRKMFNSADRSSVSSEASRLTI